MTILTLALSPTDRHETQPLRSSLTGQKISPRPWDSTDSRWSLVHLPQNVASHDLASRTRALTATLTQDYSDLQIPIICASYLRNAGHMYGIG